MKPIEPEVIFTYRPDQLSVAQWRCVIAACEEFEERLLEGPPISVGEFASLFPDLPPELLIPELARVEVDMQEVEDLDVLSGQGERHSEERYLLLEEIRSGGMGQVFRAFDRRCGRLVALKRIRREFSDDPQVRKRFRAEVELTAGLEHPGIIPIYDQSVDSDGREFYVMRLIHGDGTGTLQQAITRFHLSERHHRENGWYRWDLRRRNEFRKLIESVLIVSDTTAHAHSRGVAHRDLKPSNVLVGPYGETLVADWGLAKRIDHSEPKQSRLETGKSSLMFPPQIGFSWESNSNGVGTPGFRAPELKSGAATANLVAADIYSLGAILDCVIHGTVQRNPESGETRETFAIPRSVMPLVAIAKKALSSVSVDRYQDANSMCLDLRNWLAGEPVSAYPETFVERLWNWPSRNRLLASAVAGALVIALVSTGLFSWYQGKQKTELRRALNSASNLLIENQRAKRSVEESFSQRESLALHAIVEFQSLLTLNPLLQSAPEFHVVREKVLKESRSFYESLVKSFEQSKQYDDISLGRLTDAALALVFLENELGNTTAALSVAESACQRLRDSQHSSALIAYHLGRVLAFRGNIAARHGQKQGLADQEEAVRQLEPLLDSDKLSPEQRRDAASLWSRAASPLAIGMMSKGDYQKPKELLQKILEVLESDPTDNLKTELLKIQSHGNFALVRYYSKDVPGAYESLASAEFAVKGFERLMDAGTPIRDIVEFEVLREFLLRFKSDLMLTEGKVEPAIALKEESLSILTRAVEAYPVSTEIQTAFQACINRLLTVFAEQGRILRAKEIANAWLDLALRIKERDKANLRTHEFLSLAYHSKGHLSEKTNDPNEAERCYAESLSILSSMDGEMQDAETVLGQAIELNMHLIQFALKSGRFEAAEKHFDDAIRVAVRLKGLDAESEFYQINIKRLTEISFRSLQESDIRERRGSWMERLRAAGLVPRE